MRGGANSIFGLFGIASLIAVLVGCWTAARVGFTIGLWGQMIVTWALGLSLAIAIARVAVTKRWQHVAFAGVVMAGLLACFVDTGLQGVHRWVVIGPVRFNVAALTLPMLVVLLGQSGRAVLAMLPIVLLVAQPDAAQASALAAAVLCLLSIGDRWRESVVVGGALAALVTAAWLRPDPLPRLPEVEGIVGLGWQQSPSVAILGVVALGVATLAPLRAGFRSGDRTATALAAYFAANAIASVIAALPVPLIGMSVSPVIGFWLGIGALASAQRTQ